MAQSNEGQLELEQLRRHQIDQYLEPDSQQTDEEWLVTLEHEIGASLYSWEPEDSQYAATRIRAWRNAHGGQAGKTREMLRLSPPAPDPARLLRQTALGALIADEVAQDDEVRAFRETYVPGYPLTREGMVYWIDEQREADGADHSPTYWLDDIKVPQDYASEPYIRVGDRIVATKPLALEIPAQQVYTAFHYRFLHYDWPMLDESHKIPVRDGGVLDQLRQLSERLAQEFRWTAGQATSFVLTDAPPDLDPVTAQVELHERWPELSRLTLTVDPAVAPRELEQFYSHFRQFLMSRWQRKRFRDSDEKHLHLALCAVQRPKDERWQDTMLRWNEVHQKDHPEWRYEDVDRFRIHCQQARRQMLGKQKRA